MATKRNNMLVGVLIVVVFCVMLFGTGILSLQRGCSAWTSMGSLPSDAQGGVINDLICGTVFILGGVWVLLFAMADTLEKTPNIVFACLWSAFLLILSSPFLYNGIAHPESIQGFGFISIANGSHIFFSHKTGRWISGTVFVLAGSTCLGIIPFVWRHYRRKGLLTNRTSNNK
jgi:hypothetical protein